MTINFLALSRMYYASSAAWGCPQQQGLVMFGAEEKEEEQKGGGTPYYPLGFPMKPPREVNRTLETARSIGRFCPDWPDETDT